jgi:hypothetical protein
MAFTGKFRPGIPGLPPSNAPILPAVDPRQIRKPGAADGRYAAAGAPPAAAPSDAARSILDALDSDGLFRALDPGKILEALGLADDACRATIKGAILACSRHGYMDAVAKLREALPLVPRNEEVRHVSGYPDTSELASLDHGDHMGLSAAERSEDLGIDHAETQGDGIVFTTDVSTDVGKAGRKKGK